MPRAKKPPQHDSELADVVQEIGQSLHRLVDLGQSVLDALERSSATTAAAVDSGSPPATGSRSVRSSIHSENSPDTGVIDVAEEDVISFAQASAMVPTQPPPSISTISRWCSIACRGIVMDSFYIAGRRKTTRQAVERFLLACREQKWAGMHDATAFHLERALAEKDRLHDQQADDDQDAGPAQTAPDGAESTPAGTRKYGRKVPSTRGSSGRGKKQARRGA